MGDKLVGSSNSKWILYFCIPLKSGTEKIEVVIFLHHDGEDGKNLVDEYGQLNLGLDHKSVSQVGRITPRRNH